MAKKELNLSEDEFWGMTPRSFFKLLAIFAKTLEPGEDAGRIMTAQEIMRKNQAAERFGL